MITTFVWSAHNSQWLCQEELNQKPLVFTEDFWVTNNSVNATTITATDKSANKANMMKSNSRSIRRNRMETFPKQIHLHIRFRCSLYRVSWSPSHATFAGWPQRSHLRLENPTSMFLIIFLISHSMLSWALNTVPFRAWHKSIFFIWRKSVCSFSWPTIDNVFLIAL